MLRGFRLQEDDYEWLANEYPNTFERHYMPYFRRLDDHVLAGASKGLPAVCTVCNLPLEFPNPDNMEERWTQYSEYNNKTYPTCSPGCKHIFDHEPEKYSQIWYSAEAFANGELGED